MVHSILAWLHLGLNISILNTVTWMREDACGSPVKNGHWLLEATQCFNQLQVHTHVKPSSSSRKGMVLPAAVRLGSPSLWTLSSGCHALSIGISKGCSQSTFLPLQLFTCVFRTEPFSMTVWVCAAIPGPTRWILIFMPVPLLTILSCHLNLHFQHEPHLFRSWFSCCTMTQVLRGPQEPLHTIPPSLPCLHPSSSSKEHTDDAYGALKPSPAPPSWITPWSLCLESENFISFRSLFRPWSFIWMFITSRPFSILRALSLTPEHHKEGVVSLTVS